MNAEGIASRLPAFFQTLTSIQTDLREKLEKRPKKPASTEVTIFNAGFKVDAGGKMGEVYIVGGDSAILDASQRRMLQEYEKEKKLTPSIFEERPDGKFLVKMTK